MLHGPLYEALTRRQIHDVVLVYPGRAEQQRDLVHFGGCRCVLDQLDQLAAVDHLPLGRGHVHTEGERRRVDLPRPPAVVPQVVDEVACAAHQALAAGVEGGPQRDRVSGQCVRRRECVQQKLGGEAGLARRVRVQLSGLDQVLREPFSQQVRLPKCKEIRVLLECRVAEPSISRVGGARPVRQIADRSAGCCPDQPGESGR